MSSLDKLINAVSTPAAEAIGRVVETTGKTSAIAGGATYAVDKVASIPWGITEYAAMVSITGGLVWITKNLFDMWLAWLKFRRGD